MTGFVVAPRAARPRLKRRLTVTCAMKKEKKVAVSKAAKGIAGVVGAFLPARAVASTSLDIAKYLSTRWGLPDQVVLAAISTLPIVELRGGVPIGYLMGFHPLTIYYTCVLGNFLPVIPLFFALRMKIVRQLIGGLVARARSLGEDFGDSRKGLIALALFVGIPLPGTGAWTGTMVAYVLGMNALPAFFSIFVGIGLSGLIMSALCIMGTYYAAGAGAFMLLAGTASMFVGRRTPLLDGPLEGEAVDVEVKQELPVSQPGRTPTGKTQKTVDDKSEEKLDETIAAEESDTEEKAPKKPGFFQRLWSKEPAPDEEEEQQQQEMEPKLEVPEPVDVDKKTETETEDDLPSSEDAKTETKREGPFSFLTKAFSTPEPASEEAEEDKVGEDSLQPELEKAEAMAPEPKMEEFVAEIPKIVVEEPLTEVKADEVAASVTEEVADEVAIKTEDTEERKNLFSRLFANLSPGPPVSEKLEEKEAQTESEASEALIAEPEKLVEEPVAKVKENVVETVDPVISETKDTFPDIVPSVKDEKLQSDDVKAESVLENLTEDLTPPASGLRERKRDMLARLVKKLTTSEEDSEESLEENAEYIYVDEDGNELDPSAYAIDETGEAVQYVYVDEDGNEVDASTHRATTDADKDVAIVYVDEDGNEMDPSEYELDENGETVTYVYVDEDGNEINPEDLEDDEDGDVSSGSKPKRMRKRDMISNFIQKLAEPVTSVLKGDDDKANEQENQRTEEELQELKEKRIQATFQKFYDRKL